MRTYFQAHLKEALGMLDEMEQPLETPDEFYADVASPFHRMPARLLPRRLRTTSSPA